MNNNPLERWGNLLPVQREYYGDDKARKPNNHCEWCNIKDLMGWYEKEGWYETDENLKKRAVYKMAQGQV